MEKTILYFAQCPQQFDRFVDLMRELPEISVCNSGDVTICEYEGRKFRFIARYNAESALELLHRSYLNLVVFDLLCPGGVSERLQLRERHALSLLEPMDQEKNVEARYDFGRILMLVSSPVDDEVDQGIARFGRLGVGRFARDWSACSLCPPEQRQTLRLEFGRKLLREMLEAMTRLQVGKTALCLCGGGITGIYFEMGVLKCLDDCLSGNAINSFDMNFGISAGAVVSGLIANGYSIDEFMAGIAGMEGGRLPVISLNLFRAAHFDYGRLGKRMKDVSHKLTSQLIRGLKGQSGMDLETLYVDYRDLLPALWHGGAYEEILQKVLSAPGATDDFRDLPRPLFVGATDQDLKTHHLFGVHGVSDDVPISRAIRASMSINPVFVSTPIKGRYFEDGAVTRTSNFEEAIYRGADLIFVVDPFVPYISKTPGYAHRRGLAYNIDQDIRTISYTRYERSRDYAVRHHQTRSIYTFVPANHLRQLMSIFPMDHRPYLRIWRGAYLSTLHRLQTIGYRMKGDLEVHGIRLDLNRAEEVAQRLQATRQPKFEDFFPDGKILLRTPPLCRQVLRSSRLSALSQLRSGEERQRSA